MKKHLLSILIFCSAIILSLGASILFSAHQANFLASAFAREAEDFNEAAPNDLADLRNAGDEQLDAWAENLESFDGRNYNYITPARHQYDRNTCWAYAAVGAVEANILRNGIDQDVTKETLNLDETITAYTRHTRDGSQDPLFLTADDTYDYGKWNQGDPGAVNAFSIMTQGYTLVEENNFHSSVSEDVLKSKLKQSKYYVKSYQSVSSDRNAIKRAILQYGAVTFNYSGPSDYLYYDPSAAANHTSIIIGWDDTVKSSDFKPKKPDSDGAWIIKNSWGNQTGYNEVNGTYCYYISYELPIGGLYAVDMAMTEDYQNIYHYDGDVTVSRNKSAGEAQAAIYEAKLSSPTKQEQLKAVMVYVKDDDLNVNIKIYKNLTANPGNVNDEINIPDKGELAIEMNTHVNQSGMHTIDLENAINLEQGEFFSIVVKCTTKAGVSVPVNCAVDERSINDMTYYLQDGKWVNFKKSDFYADSGTDKRTAKIRAITNTVERETGSDNDLKYARVEIAHRLVYYARDTQLLPEMQVSLDGVLLECGRDYRAEVQEIRSPGKTAITISGEGAYQGTRTTYFEVAKAKNPPEVVPSEMSVYNDVTYLREIPSPDGWEWADKDTKLGYGTNAVSLIYVGEDRAFYQNLSREFYVNKLDQDPPADLDISTAVVEIVGEYVYTGEPILPSVRVTRENIELRNGIDYTLTAQDNRDAGTATVIVKGSGRYFNQISQTFVIQKAEKPSVDTTIHCNQKVSKLSEISLPEGFVWEDETLEITGNPFTAKAMYTGKDAGNYKITEFTFEIIIEEEQNPEEGTPEEGNPDEQNPEEGNPEEGNPEEGNPGEGNPGEQNPEGQNPDEQNPEEGTPEEGNPEEGNPGEQSPEAQNPEEENPEEEQGREPEDPKQEIWLGVAIGVPAAVLIIAGSGIAIFVRRRKKQ